MNKKLASNKLSDRIICVSVLLLVVFLSVTILSNLLLPEGFLLRKNSATDFETSSNVIVCTIQIFLWNMISIVAIFITSLFAKKRKENDEYVSLSYWIYFFGVLQAAVTLGTGSFTAATVSVSVFQRIAEMFNVFKNAGLVELFGQLLITCAVANKYLVMTYKKETTTRKMKDVKWTRSETICLIAGFLLKLVAAFIESNSILGI